MGRVGLTPNDVYGPPQSLLKMRFQEFCQVDATHSVKTCPKSPEYGVRPGCADRVVIGGMLVLGKDASSVIELPTPGAATEIVISLYPGQMSAQRNRNIVG